MSTFTFDLYFFVCKTFTSIWVFIHCGITAFIWVFFPLHCLDIWTFGHSRNENNLFRLQASALYKCRVRVLIKQRWGFNTQTSSGRFHHPIPTTGAQMSLLVDNKSSVTKQPLLPEWQIALMTPKCHFCWDNKWLFAGHKVGMRECWFSWCWAFIKLPPHNCSCWINIKPAVHMQPACGASQVQFPWNSVFPLWKK